MGRKRGRRASHPLPSLCLRLASPVGEGKWNVLEVCAVWARDVWEQGMWQAWERVDDEQSWVLSGLCVKFCRLR